MNYSMGVLAALYSFVCFSIAYWTDMFLFTMIGIVSFVIGCWEIFLAAPDDEDCHQ